MTTMKSLGYLTAGGLALMLLAVTPATAQNYQQQGHDRHDSGQSRDYDTGRDYSDAEYYRDRYENERETHRRHDAQHARQHQRQHASQHQRQQALEHQRRHARQHQRQHQLQHDRQHRRTW